MVAAIGFVLLLVALFLQVKGKKPSLDRRDVQRVRRYSETVRRDEALPFD
jgi:hypothetical protein